MANPISPVDAIGDSTTRRVTSYPYQGYVHYGNATPEVPAERPAPELRPGAPADVVELSADGQTLSILPPHISLRFLINEETKEIVIQVVDNTTDEVIRQVPPVELYDTLMKLR